MKAKDRSDACAVKMSAQALRERGENIQSSKTEDEHKAKLLARRQHQSLEDEDREDNKTKILKDVDRGICVIQSVRVDAVTGDSAIPKPRDGNAGQKAREEGLDAVSDGEEEHYPAHNSDSMSHCNAEKLQHNGDFDRGESEIVGDDACE